jgi:hypothetical protein
MGRGAEAAMTQPVLISIHPDYESPGGDDQEYGGESGILRLRSGERISGTVEVKVLEDVDFEAFQIGFLWHTEGKGNRVTGGGGAEALAREGAWRAGDRLTLPFTLSTPSGPLSYSGRLLSVVWELEARVCRSMLRTDIREDLPVILSGDPEVSEFDFGPKPQTADRMEAAKRGLRRVWFTLGLLLLLGTLVFGVIRSWDFQGWERLPLFLAISGGFLLTLKGMWGRLGRGKLGEPTVHVSTKELCRGEEVLYSLVLRPEQRTELRSLEIILECEERVVRGHGQYRSHRRKKVFEKRRSLAKDLVVEPHRGVRKKGAISIPDDGPTTFCASDNQVVWWLHFRADIVGWPDWKDPHLLRIKP